MADSEDSEVDVCTVDDEDAAKNMHSGLTLVAAELFLSDGSTKGEEEQLVPLKKTDLLKKTTKEFEGDRVNYSKVDSGAGIEQIEKKPLKNESAHPTEASTKSRKSSLQGDNLVKLEESRSGEECDTEDEKFDSGETNLLNQFAFESDHMAIRNNSDYHSLLKTLAILEAQQVQAIKDLEELERLKSQALKDPLAFVKNLQDKTGPKFPERQAVARIPSINWQHYMSAYSGDRVIPQVATRNTLKSQHKQENLDDIDTSNWLDDDDFQVSDSQNKSKVKNDDKPTTFNQKWTAEEQEKLEKLLILFPPEEVEARRWEKIAKALGNRTSTQVSSRIQKYFVKLAKAKLPIPGRTPNGITIANAKKAKLNPVNFKNSTFFPSWRPTVAMEEDDNEGENYYEKKFLEESNQNNSDEDRLPEELRNEPEYQELQDLKKLRKMMQQKSQERSGPVVHTGFMCDGCKVSPIVGVRWHCTDCVQSIDFCNNCAQMYVGINTETHKSDHNLTPIDETNDATVMDGDYLTFEQRNKFKYNYLDPNFQPNSKVS